LGILKYEPEAFPSKHVMKPDINFKYCKGCNICLFICPKECYSKGTALSDLGYYVPIVSSPEKCFNHGRTGKMLCELCVLSCPDLAITWAEEG